FVSSFFAQPGCLAVGTEEEFPANTISITPNPSNDQFSLYSPFGNSSMEIFDVSGKMIKRLSYSDSSPHQFGSDLPSGIYFARITSEKKSAVLKIVKTEDN